jgi:hypothetical protein
MADAEAARTSLANHVVVPRWFFVPVGAGVALQIATTAAGLVGVGKASGWLLAGGFVLLLAVAAMQLARFRRLNGVWLGGLASRVIGGTATSASVSYGAALGGAIWAASARTWWLVGFCAVAGGVGYALSGVAWMRTYRSQPAVHSRGEPAAWLAVLAGLALLGLVLLVTLR